MARREKLGLLLKYNRSPVFSYLYRYDIVVSRNPVKKSDRLLFVPYSSKEGYEQLREFASRRIGQIQIARYKTTSIELYPYEEIPSAYRTGIERKSLGTVLEGLALAHYYLQFKNGGKDHMMQHNHAPNSERERMLERTGREAANKSPSQMRIEDELLAIRKYCQNTRNPATEAFLRYFDAKLAKRFPDRFRELHP